MCERFQIGLEVGQDAPVMTVSNADTRATICRVVLLDKNDIEHARKLLEIAEQWIAFRGVSNGSN